MASYSHTKLGTFQQCKYKYKLQYIDKVKVDVPTTIEAFMGSLVHKALEKLYRDLKFQKINTKQELLDFFEKEWQGNWDDNILIAKYSKENYKEMGKRFIGDYYEHYKPFDKWKTIELETEYKLPLSNGNFYHIRIDRLACDNEGNYYVCDYKTNNKLKLQEELDEDRQLAMYSIWVKNNFKDCKSVKLVWYFLAFDKEMISERNDEQLNKLKEETEDFIKEIESCNNFPTNVTPLCEWCVYKQICPSWKHEFELKEKTPEEFRDDDGVKMVDEYAEIDEKERQLKARKEKLKEQLISFAKQKQINRIFGTEKKISVKLSPKVVIPDKNVLKEVLKEKGIYYEVSMLNYSKLNSLIIKGQIDSEVVKKVKIEREYKITMSNK